MIVHKQILLPLRTRFCVMAKQNMIKAEPKQLLRCQQGHSRLFGRAVTLSLITFNASRDQIRRRAFSALCTRQNMIERQVLRVLVIAAILTAITVADINPGTLHRGFPSIPADVYIMPKTDHRRNFKCCRRRTEHIVAVVLFDEHSSAKPKTNRAGYADRAERFVRKVQKQYSSC